MATPFRPTNYRVKQGIQRMSGTNSNNATGYETKPLDELKGIREAKLKKIDLNKIAENGWYVEYTDSGKVAKVQMSSDLGVEYAPDGDIKNGVLYPDKEITVKVATDNSGNYSHIISVSQINRTTNLTPTGATRLVTGDSDVVVKDKEVQINTENFFINGVEGTGNSFVFCADDTPDALKARATYYCDGTDDALVIQKVIDANPKGALLDFTPGTYTINQITIGENFIIHGAGASTIFKAKANSLAPMIINKNAMTNTKIMYIKFDGNKTNQTETVSLIKLSNANNCTIQNCEMENTIGTGIELESSSNNLITAVNITGTGNNLILTSAGIKIIDGIDNTIKNCKLNNNNGNGIYSRGNKGLKLDTIDAMDNQLNGYFSENDQYIKMKLSTLQGNGVAGTTTHAFGVLIFDGTYNSYTDNTMTDYKTTKTQRHGISMVDNSESYTGPDYYIIKHNILVQNLVGAKTTVGAHNIVSDNIEG